MNSPLPLTLVKAKLFIDNLQMVEYTPKEVIQALLKSPHLLQHWDNQNHQHKMSQQIYINEKHQIEEYLVLSKNDCVPVRYNQPHHGWGRPYIYKSLGFTAFRRPVRNTFLGKNYDDFDMENAQPVLLQNICHSHNIPCPKTDIYCANRDSILEEVGRIYSVDRGCAKKLFLRLFFKGTVDNWIKENNIPVPKTSYSFLFDLQKELDEIAQTLKRSNPELYNTAKALKQAKNQKNYIGSFLAFYLQEAEKRVMSGIMEWMAKETSLFKKKGVDGLVGAYEYDGIKLLKANVKKYGKAKLIQDLEAKVFELFGFHIKWTVKDVDDQYDISRELMEVKNGAYEEPKTVKVPIKKGGGMEYIRRLFQLDYTGINRIVETSEFVSQEGTPAENNISTLCKFLILFAYMGRGKSTAIKRIVPLYKSFVIITPRQAFALFMAEEFKADNYLDGHFASTKQIISLESLPKLTKLDYELVILDECESILSNFSSTTLNGKHITIFNQLMALLKQSKKVIFADAFVSNRTLDLVRSLEGTAAIIENTTAPVPRTAFEIHPDSFFEKQIELVKDGKKLFACYSSVGKLREDIAKFKGIALVSTEMKEFVEKIQEYHGRVSDSVMRTLNNINTSWQNASMVLTSPSITVGNSYSNPNDFDTTMILGAPTCTVRDTFQTQMRVRHLKDNNLYYALPKDSAMNFSKIRADLIFKVLEEYELFNMEKKDIVIGLLDKVIAEREKNKEESYGLKCLKMSYEQAETCPDNLKKILYYNLFEQTVSCRYYKDLFGFFLNKCGYSVQGSNKKHRGKSLNVNMMPACDMIISKPSLGNDKNKSKR